MCMSPLSMGVSSAFPSLTCQCLGAGMDMRSSLCASVCPLAQSTEVQKLSFTPTSLAVGSGYIAAGGQCSQVRVAQAFQFLPPRQLGETSEGV